MADRLRSLGCVGRPAQATPLLREAANLVIKRVVHGHLPVELDGDLGLKAACLDRAAWRRKGGKRPGRNELMCDGACFNARRSLYTLL